MATKKKVEPKVEAPAGDMITVLFKQNYYPGYGTGVGMYEKGEAYEIAADTPIPSRDIEILEGESTYLKARAAKKAASEKK